MEGWKKGAVNVGIWLFIITLSMGCLIEVNIGNTPSEDFRVVEFCELIEYKDKQGHTYSERCLVNESSVYGWINYQTIGDSFFAEIFAKGLKPNTDYLMEMGGPEFLINPGEREIYYPYNCTDFGNTNRHRIKFVTSDEFGYLNADLDYKGRGNCILKGNYTKAGFRIMGEPVLLSTEDLRFEVQERPSK